MPLAAEPHLRKFFTEFGSGYIDEERRRSEYAEERLREIASKESGRLKERARIVSAVAFSASCGVALFLI